MKADAHNIACADPNTPTPSGHESSVDVSPAATSGYPILERWYVVHTQPHSEARAELHLERQHYRVFFPRYRKTVTHARKKMSKFSPLFPSYLFLQLNLSRDQWRSINGTRGVVRLITSGDTPQAVPPGIIEALLNRVDADGAMHWIPLFEVGQSVRISEGPFSDFVGTLEHLDAAGRVRVLLNLLGRTVSVALRGEYIIPTV